MMNKTTQAFLILEKYHPGYFAAIVEQCLAGNGVVHASCDCFLAGVPCDDNPDCLRIVFQCSHLPSLRAVLNSIPFSRIRWSRSLSRPDNLSYGTRERSISDFSRHASFGLPLTNQSNA